MRMFPLSLRCDDAPLAKVPDHVLVHSSASALGATTKARGDSLRILDVESLLPRDISGYETLASLRVGGLEGSDVAKHPGSGSR